MTTKSYHVINVKTQELVKDGVGDPIIYTSSNDAAEAAKLLSETTGTKYQPRPVPAIDDPNWRDREISRFNIDVYERLPPNIAKYFLPDTFPHVSKDRPGMISYTQNEVKGRADIQTRISLRGYLEKVLKMIKDTEIMDRLRHEASLNLYYKQKFLNADFLSPEEQHWQEMSIRASKIGTWLENVEYLNNKTIDKVVEEFERNFTEQTVKFAKTADEIVSVYTNYDSSVESLRVSCMALPAEKYNGHLHPVAVYGDSDLQVAYTTNSEGQTTSRAVVWPEKKIYSRVYGSTPAFHDALAKLGYKKSRGYYSSHEKNIGDTDLSGARIRAIPDKNGYGYIMPYIDEHNCCELSGDDQWFILSIYSDIFGTGYCRCQTTCGTTEEYSAVCDCCGEGMDEDEAVTIYITSDMRGSEIWCPYCAENMAFYCDGRLVEFASSCVNEIVTHDGTSYSQRYFEEHGGFYCEETENYYIGVDSVTIADTGRTVCESIAEAKYYYCLEDNKWYEERENAPDYQDDNKDEAA